MKIIAAFRNLLLLILSTGLSLCAFCLLQTYSYYREADNVNVLMAQYKPVETSGAADDEAQVEEKRVVNKSIHEMKQKFPDLCGWITVEDTQIDYAYARAEDNNYYLEKSIEGKNFKYGTLFIDCRNPKDFSTFNTIMYGHNMKSGKMFGEIDKYQSKSFFEEHKKVKILLPEATCEFEVFACLVVTSADKVIYNAYISTDDEVADFSAYVKKNAKQYSETNLTKTDRVLALSTCSYEFTGARTVVLAKLNANAD